MAPISGKFIGDFSFFNTAVDGALAKLSTFEGDAAKVGRSLNRMADSFSGKKLIQEATLMSQAVEQIGGTSKLTERELQRLAVTTNEAVSKMRAMGIDIPERLQKVADQTRHLTVATQDARSGFEKMGAAVASFIGNFAANLVQNAISSVINLGKAALASAGNVADLSEKLGISVEAVQGFQYAAEQSGTTIDAFGSAINKLNLNLGTGSKATKDAFKDLGLSFDDIRRMNPEQAFLATTDALAKIKDQAELTRLGVAVMGKGFVEIIPAIKGGIRETADAITKFSQDEITALDNAGDAWGRWYTTLKVWTGKAMIAAEEAGSWIYRQLFVNPTQRPVVGGSLAADPTKTLNAAFLTQSAREAVAAKAGGATIHDAEAEAAQIEAAKKAVEVLKQQRAALESLGIVTKEQVNRELAELARLQALAEKEGIAHNVVLAKMVPHLTEVAKGAKASGSETKELTARVSEANKAWRETVNFNFDQAGGFTAVPGVLALTVTEAQRLNDVMSPEKWHAKRAGEAMERLGHQSAKQLAAAVSVLETDYAAVIAHFGRGSREAAAVLEKLTAAHVAAAGAVPPLWERAEEAMHRMGITSQRELDALAKKAQEDYALIAAAVGANSAQAIAAFQAMIEAQKRASGELPTYWEREVIPRIAGLVGGLTQAMSDALGAMLVGMVSFKDGMVGVWRSLQQSIAQILSEILNDFVNRFLRGMIGAVLGQRGAMSNAFASMFAGGGSSGGGLMSMLGSGLLTGLGGAAPVSGMLVGGSALGGGSFATGAIPANFGTMGAGGAGGAGAGAGMLGTFAGPAAGAGVGLGVGYLTRSKAWGAGTGAAAGAGIGAMFGGPIGAGIGAGVGAIGGLIGGMLGGQKEHKQVNDLRDAFIGAAGGIDQLRDTAHEAGLTLDKLLNAKKVSEFEAAVRGLEPALAAVAKEAEVAQRYALTFADFGAGTPERAKRLDADVAALTGDFKTLIALGVEHDIAVRRVGAAYVDLAVAAVQAGEEIPAAMAPVLRDLAEMGALTEAQAAALLGMTDAAGPSWQEMTSAAERYGIALDQLGQRYQQLKINDVAEAFAKDFDLLQEGGVDTSVLFEGMKEEISTIVQEAIKYGLTIPKSMEPVITSMMEQGYVTNEAGDALRDVAAIKFADPVISEVDKLILKLDELIATLTTKLAPAFASIPANFDWSGYNEFAAQQAAHPSLTPATVPDAAYQPGTLIPMKDGGTGSVSRATSFMAGEAGTEEFAFSGAGRTFGRLEMNGVERRLDLLRQDLVDERNARIRTAQRSRIDQANVLLTRAR